MITVFTTRDRSNLNISVRLGDKWRVVKFSPPVIHGNVLSSTFSTNSTELTEALKKHRWYNKMFFVERTIESSTPKESVKRELTIEECLKDPSTAIHCETVTTKAMAITYIQGMFEESFSAPNMSVEEMKREAARRWNVHFTKWGN